MRERSHRRRGSVQTSKPWYERSAGAIRLGADRSLVSREYPGLAFRVDDEHKKVLLEGAITLVEPCRVPTRIAIRIELPAAYPESEPTAYDSENRFPHNAERHFYQDGCCCLWLPPETLWEPDDPLSLLRFLDEVSIFFHQQLVFASTGCVVWPGAERGHNIQGYIEFVEEQLGADARILIPILAPVLAGRLRIGRNQTCPCSLGCKYKDCHQPVVDLLTRRIGLVRTRKVFQRWLDKEPQKVENTLHRD